ncbi:MAG: gliding motility-associated ABC transporter ATP-binding subunit GldA [Cyclobacteriaceae bacterium]|nr:gliding motility-associated ABC transporter ATP-binding subunit GldA [Cyclobacteriaceae bacterium]
MSVEVTHLTKTFNRQKAVNDISFEVSKGEILGFLGPNGAGKSTTMKIATSYIPPTSGHVKICGFDVVDNPMKVKEVVGYLPEHNPLYLEMYVREYLHFVGGIHGLKGIQLKSRVEEMIDLCGLGIEQNKRIEALSKGYRQRVGLAQALIHDPEVLILDEPTTGLDPNQLLEVRALIKNIGQNKTVVLSTHIMQEVQALCDRIVVIDKGKIVANDQLDQLKNNQTTLNKVIVELDKEVDELFWGVLKHIQKVEILGKKNYALICALENDIRKDIFKLVSENGIVLLGMKQEEANMENIFQKLTKNTTGK